MSSIDEAAVKRVASLARLVISDEETKRYAEQLSAILGFIDQLSELDTDGVEPTAHPLPVRNVFRADEVGQSLSFDEALREAPSRQDNYFLVPKVLDQGSA